MHYRHFHIQYTVEKSKSLDKEVQKKSLELIFVQKQISEDPPLLASDRVGGRGWGLECDPSPSCPPASSSSRSETTSTGRGTRSSAWPGWPKTSWPRSPTSCCPSWRAEGSSRGRRSPPRRCRTSASASELLPPYPSVPRHPSLPRLHSPPPLRRYLSL